MHFFLGPEIFPPFTVFSGIILAEISAVVPATPAVPASFEGLSLFGKQKKVRSQIGTPEKGNLLPENGAILV
jgi:hypothetical protein